MPSKALRTTVLALLVSFGFVDAASAYYSPRTGRFLSRDPIGEPGARLVMRVTATSAFVPRDSLREQSHLYRYVSNTPTNRIDPRGLQECCRCGPDITQAITDHLNAFVGQKQGDLSWFWPSGARALERYATPNGTAIFNAAQ